jgi:hypothetical protein
MKGFNLSDEEIIEYKILPFSREEVIVNSYSVYYMEQK